MGLFDGCLLASDIDGTLMTNGVISQRSVEKIEYFLAQGGLFSLSTGRSIDAVAPVLSKIKDISPSVVENGCIIYDYKNNKSLFDAYLPESDYHIVKKVMNLNLKIGIEVHCENRILTIMRTRQTDDHQEYEWLSTEFVSYEEASKYQWNKVIYLFNNATIEKKAVQDLIKNENTSSDFVDTSATIKGEDRYYYEQFPIGISKYSSLEKLCELFKIKKGNLFAIGDYYNDLEMIQKADIGAAPSGSPDDIKSSADFVTGPCEKGAVADFIDYLIKIRKERYYE